MSANTGLCMGGCGRTVTHPGMWCSSCWAFAERETMSPCVRLLEASLNLLRAEQKDDRPAFLAHLETVAHLVSVIQHQTYQAAQTKPNT